MGDRAMNASEVATLASLPPKDELVARLLGQLQAPMSGLVHVLNGPIAGLTRVLQRHVENMGQEASAP